MPTPTSEPELNGNRIADTSIRQPVFVTMLMLVAVVIGALAYTTLPVNLLPDIDVQVIAVTVAYPGAGPESVADQVAKPLEDELSSLSGVTTITSNSSEGVAAISIEFTQETDMEAALQDVREHVGLVRSRLPREVEEPLFRRLDPAQQPILTLAMSGSGSTDPAQLRRLLEDEVIPTIQNAPGVGSTTLTGGLVRQINVQLDLQHLTARRILPSQVSNAIAAANTNLGLGDVTIGDQGVNLRVPSALAAPSDIAEIGIPGTDYAIKDIATIEDGTADVETYSRLNGADAISLDIRKQSGTNTVAVADAALASLDRALERYPDLSYHILRNDAEQVRSNVNGAIEEMLLAVLFALLVVLFFFRDLRNTLVTVAGLPVILIATFALMSLFGMTINILTLLALSLSVGLVIDDAIVVRENIFRHMQRGVSPRDAASRGTAEVSLSVLAMTLTIIAVFLPVAFTSGLTGNIFRAFGLTVAGAMAISLVEAFTLAPMLSAFFFGRQRVHARQVAAGEEHLPDEAHEELGRIERVYERLLGWTLRHRSVAVVVAVVVVAGSVVAARGVQFAFLPDPGQNEFGMRFELPPGALLGQTDQRARQAEQILLADPAVEAVLSRVGGPGTPEVATFFVKLHEDATAAAAQERLRPQFAGFPEIAFSLNSYQTGTSTEVTARPLRLQVRSTRSPEELAPLVEQIRQAFVGIPGLADVDTTYTPGKPEIQFKLQPGRASDYGLSNNDMARTLRALVDGDRAAVFRDGGKDYDIVVRLNAGDRQDFNALRSLRLPLGGASVPLNSLASIERDSSATTIRRENRLTSIIIGGNNIGRNINAVQADMQARLQGVALPPDVTISFGGATEDQNEGFSSILIAMGLSVLFVYVVLASQFASFTQPLVIMLAMPLSFIGAFLALNITGITLNIAAMIGLIMLLGLVTKNSILLIDFTNILRRAGMDKDAAIQRASAVRLRPILMTSTAILMGSVPSALGLGEGVELRRGLAVVIIGGMLTSTLLTLLLVPTAYSLLESATQWLSGLFRRTPQPAALATATARSGGAIQAPPRQNNAKHDQHPHPSGLDGTSSGAGVVQGEPT